MNKTYQAAQELICNDLKNRNYRIGLDLGVGSIGYAVVALLDVEGKTIPTELILEGSRIFTASIGAKDRRMKRGARNAHRHNRNRLLSLWKFLAEYGMMKPIMDHKQRRLMQNTADAMFDPEIQKLSPYELRLKALSTKLELPQLGYALYHLANHRGSSSIRINLGASEEDIKAQKSILETQEFAGKHSNITTFIELLDLNNKEYEAGYRNKEGRKNNLMPTRNLILNELDKAIQVQQVFYPEIFTEYFINQLKHLINFENIKIVPDAGTCLFYPNEQKLPKCHFLNEERRLWEALNNSRIGGEPLLLEHKQQFFTYLREGKELTEATVRKLLNLDKYTAITLQGRSKKEQKIKGFQFKTLEDKAFWGKLSDPEKDNFFYDWTNCADDNVLLTLLQDKYHLDFQEAHDALSSISLIGDYAPIGKSAMIIILEYIKNSSLSYQEAIALAIQEGKLILQQEKQTYNLLPYYGEVLNESTQPLIGKAWHSLLRDKFEIHQYKTPNTDKNEKKFGRIANPVVHQTLNELRKLVNEIITVLGKKPTEIGIELSRELKVGLEEREKISRSQSNNETTNKRIFETYCEPNQVTDRKYILRYKLSEEQAFKCPYCLEQFNCQQVAQGDVDIDHIFPESQSADNSVNNLIMAHKRCNETLKGAKTPYQAFYGTAKWGEIEHFVLEQMPTKAWRFKLNSDQYKEWLDHRGFLARFSTDTSYIAKASAQYLDCLFEPTSKKNVRTLKGGETATLRKAWGLQGLTHELGARFVPDDNGIYFDPQKKMRLDHRHHALDAITIAYSTNGYTKLINTLYKKGVPLYKIQKMVPLPHLTKVYQEESIDEQALGDKETFIRYIKDHIENKSFISIKYDHDKNGQLLKDTAFTILFEKNNQLILVAKKKITSIEENLEDINKSLAPKMYTGSKLDQYSQYEQILLKKLLNHNEHKRNLLMEAMEQAEKQLISENEALKSQGKREIKVNEASIVKKALALVGGYYYSISNNDKSKKFIKTAPSETQGGVAHDTGENLCIDFYHNKEGILCGEIIRKIHAMNNNYIPQYQRNGFTCIEKVYQGDTLEINLIDHTTLNERSKGLEYEASVKAPNASYGRTFIRVDTFTEIKGGNIQIKVQNILKSQKNREASFTISSLQNWDVRRIILSPIGLVKYRSPVLKNKEK